MSSYHKHTLIIGTLTTLSCGCAIADPPCNIISDAHTRLNDADDPPLTAPVFLDNFYRYRQVLGNYYGHGIEQIPAYLQPSSASAEASQVIYHTKTISGVKPVNVPEVPFADGVVIRRALGGYKPDLLTGGMSYCRILDTTNLNPSCLTNDSLDFLVAPPSNSNNSNLVINSNIGINKPDSLPCGPTNSSPCNESLQSIYNQNSLSYNTIQWHLYPYLKSGYCAKDITLHLGLTPWAIAHTDNGNVVPPKLNYGNVVPPKKLSLWASDPTPPPPASFTLSRGTAVLDKLIFTLRSNYSNFRSWETTVCPADPTQRIDVPNFSLLSADSDNEVADPSDYGADYSYKDLYNATLKELQHYYPNSQIAPAEIGIPNSDNSDSHFYKCPWDYVTEVNPTINPPSYIAKELYGNLRNSNNNNPASSSMPWGRINATYNYFYNLEANLDPENNKPHPQIPHEIHQFRLENTQPTNQARNASWTFQVLMGIKAGYYYYSNDNNNNLKVNFRNPNRYDPTPYTRPNSPTSYRYPLNVQRVVGWGTTTGGNIGENLLLGNGFVYALLDRYRLAGNGVGSQILPLKPTSVKKYNTSENDVSTQASAIAFTNPNDNTLRSIVIATFGIGAGDSNARLNLNFANNAYSKVELKYNITPTIAPTIFLPLNFQNNWKLIRYQPDTYAFNCIKRDLQSRGYLDTDPFFPDDPTNTSSFSNCFFCDDDPVTMIKGGAAKTYLQSTKRNNIEPSPCDRENPNDPAPMSYTGLMTKQLTFDSLPANDEYIKTSFDANSKTLTITATIPTDAVIVLEPQP